MRRTPRKYTGWVLRAGETITEDAGGKIYGYKVKSVCDNGDYNMQSLNYNSDGTSTISKPVTKQTHGNVLNWVTVINPDREWLFYPNPNIHVVELDKELFEL